MSAATGSARLPLADDELHLWIARPPRFSDPAMLDRYRTLLSVAEAERMAAFRFDHLRPPFLLTRALCRLSLSRYSGVAPADWQFVAGAHGRPELAPTHHGLDLRFNLSNVAGLVACAITRGVDVGVDVESIGRGADDLSIAERYFAPREAADVRAAPPAERAERFFRYWTLKEAYIKAHGAGLSLPLDAFTMQLSHDRIEVEFDPRIDDRAEDWTFLQDRIAGDHLLAVALRNERRPLRVRAFELGPDGGIESCGWKGAGG